MLKNLIHGHKLTNVFYIRPYIRFLSTQVDWPNKIYFFMYVIMHYTENIKHRPTYIMLYIIHVISVNSFGYTIFITIQAYDYIIILYWNSRFTCIILLGAIFIQTSEWPLLCLIHRLRCRIWYVNYCNEDKLKSSISREVPDLINM